MGPGVIDFLVTHAAEVSVEEAERGGRRSLYTRPLIPTSLGVVTPGQCVVL
jgi:hypothetical protein